MLQDRVAIAGIGQTPFARRLEVSETRLALDAILAALDDAGIAPGEVDGLASYTLETTDEVEVAKCLGLGDVTFFTQVGWGGGAGPACVGQLALAIAAGQCRVGVAWRSRKRGSGGRPWAATAASGVAARWTRPHGLLRPVDEIAILARRYLHETGATREHLAAVALAAREAAQRNPAALMHGRPLALEAYLAARWISEPLCLYDACLETDGALACVLVSEERARDARHPPVLVHAFAQGLARQSHAMVDYWRDDPLRGPGFPCAQALWARSALGPADVDVAQLYDAFTPLVLFALEAYGFCGRGEAPAFVEGGTIAPGGRLPINTSGGGLAEAYVHGFNLITEGVRQLRGTSTCQVPDARTCLVTGGEGVPTSALLLRRAS